MSPNGPNADTGEHKAAELQLLAENGDMDAACRLGQMYETGDGVKKDLKSAALWYKRAAQQNYPPGLHRFAKLLLAGKGVSSEDPAKAFSLWLQGANQGDSECQNQVGLCYKEGNGTEADLKMATMWFKAAAEQGHLHAQNSLAIAYEDGIGIEKNEYEAVRWYRAAASQGNAQAMLNLALYYYHLQPEPDPLEALYWFRKAAEQGEASAQRRLGRMLFFGDRVERDLDEAIHWLRRAALQGEIDACAPLAESLLQLPNADETEVAYWCYKALPHCSWSADILGALYLTHDHKHAASLFWTASSEPGGNQYAEEQLSILEKDGHTPDKAAQYFASRRIDTGRILRGQDFLPLNPGGAPVPSDNLPIPEAVRALMGLPSWDYDSLGGPDSRARSTRRTDPEAYREPASRNWEQTTGPVFQHSTRPPSSFEFVSGFNKLPPGSILDNKYMIEDVVGKGGMSMVFRAKHLLMDRTVAIKMLLPNVAAEEHTLQRFKREAKAASSLRHPNVITVYDLGKTDQGLPYIVMDFLTGKSLAQMLELEGPMQPNRIIPILAQVCDALVSAHRANIIHRDIKPSNIMLEQTETQSDAVRLVDFGIAKSIDGTPEEQKITRTGEVFGSVVYMSPEQCLGKQLDNRTDIYSVGCILYEALTGEMPFMGATVYETMSNHISGKAPLLKPLISHHQNAHILEIIYEQACARDLDRRYPNAHILKMDLLAALE